jgi:serine/threonine protein kinase/tetratricopeptide (TPR) repeat protein
MGERNLFEAALELPPGNRGAYLDSVCAGDAALRQRLEALLRQHDQAGSFLEKPAVGTLSPVEEPAIGEGPGTVIGPYKLLEQIGEGGFGVVFMAEQTQPVRRKVALKVVKPGMDSRLVIARFEAERQALALMDHPHIARILDAGQTASGRPYFVMELVKGIPITDYCDQNRLAVRERLELFVTVCQAVQHAHQKGIIHRDIKPSNVLVTPHDGTPVVKVIDFGIAKAIGGQLTDKTLFTGFAQLVGTPPYMSPEQAGLNGLDVDTRSDIYSLGVLLYELLTGTTPFDGERLRTVGFDEMRRIIREEEPPRPSTRLSTLGLAATTVSTQRQSNPRQLSRLFRGEVDWIVMKCLEKDRNRRYETASALAADLRRHLNHEPVLACPPTLGYRLGKFLRKHRGLVASVAVVLLVLLGGIAATTAALWQARASEKQARQAEAEARQNYQRAEGNLQLARKAVDDVYEQLAEKFRELPQMQSLEREFLQKALSFYLEFAKQKSADPAIRLATAQAFLRVGLIRFKLNQHQQAEEALTQAFARLDELRAENPSEPQYRFDLASAYHALGLVRTEIRGKEQAEQAHRRAIEILEGLVGEYPNRPDCRMWLAIVNNSLGTLLHAQPQEAERAHRQAITLCEQLVAEFPEKVQYRGELVRSHYTLGLVRAKTGRSEEAEKPFRDAIALYGQQAGPLSASNYRRVLPAAHLELAKVLHALGRLDEAKESYQEAAVLYERYVADFPRIGEYWVKLYESYANLVRLLEQTGPSQETGDVCRRAVDLYVKLAGRLPEEIADQGVPRISRGLDSVLKNRSRPQEREPGYRRALEVAEKLAAQSPTFPGYRFHAGYWQSALGTVLTATGRAAEAANAYRQAKAHYSAAIELNPNHVPSLNGLALLLAACPDPQLRESGRAVELAKRAAGLTPQDHHVWNTLGTAHYRAGEWQAAITALEQSMALYAGNPESEQPASFGSFLLAMAYWQRGDKEKARQEYDRAVRWMEKHEPKDEELLRFRAEATGLLRP